MTAPTKNCIKPKPPAETGSSYDSGMTNETSPSSSVRLLVEKLTVFENNVVVRFKSGIEVEV